jgi:hypothetical protein
MGSRNQIPGGNELITGDNVGTNRNDGVKTQGKNGHPDQDGGGCIMCYSRVGIKDGRDFLFHGKGSCRQGICGTLKEHFI